MIWIIRGIQWLYNCYVGDCHCESRTSENTREQNIRYPHHTAGKLFCWKAVNKSFNQLMLIKPTIPKYSQQQHFATFLPLFSLWDLMYIRQQYSCCEWQQWNSYSIWSICGRATAARKQSTDQVLKTYEKYSLSSYMLFAS